MQTVQIFANPHQPSIDQEPGHQDLIALLPRLIVWLVRWLFGCLVVWLVGCWLLVGLLLVVGCWLVVGLLVGCWLVSRLFGRLLTFRRAFR
jgi:Flp pilus assembly protein TadB